MRRVGVGVLAMSLVLHAGAAHAQQGGSGAAPTAAVSPSLPGAAAPSTTLSSTSAQGTAQQNDLARGDLLTLEQAFAATQEGSRDLMLSRLRVASAEVDLSQGWSIIRPRASVSSTLQINDKEIELAVGPGETRTVQEKYQFSATGTVSQVLFNAPAIPGLRALYALRDAQRLSDAQLRTEVLFSVASAFYGGLALQEAVEVARRQTVDRAAHLEATRARFEVGELSKVDLLRAQIDLSTAEEDLVASEASLAGALLTLATLIGRPHDAGDFRLKRPEAPAFEGAEPEEAVTRALDERPDLAAAARQVDAAEHVVLARKLSFLPTLDAAWQGRYSPVTGFFRTDTFTWNGFLTLNWALYDGGQRFIDLQQSQIQLRQSALQREGLADKIRREVLQSRIDLRTAASNLQKAESTARLATENAELVQARFEAGLATSLDVTDAATRRFQAEVEVVRQRLNRELSLLALARAMGVLGEAAPSPGAGG